MNVTSQILLVPLSAIDHEDKTYCLTLWKDRPDEDLLTSIKRFGILHPPILHKNENNSYSIITGNKRITAARHLAQEDSVLCRIVPENTKQTDIFSLLLEDAGGRSLSIIEQIIFFEKLVKASSTMEAVPMLEQLGYKPQKHILDNLLKLRSLSEPSLLAMHRGTIQLKNGRKLLNLSETDQNQIVQLISELHFGGSKQQKLIDLCIELTKRKNMPIEEILADFPSTDEHGQHMNIPQHGAALLLWLQNKCSPQLSQTENDFKRKVARLNLPSSMHIGHTPAFENKEIILSLRFSDWHSLDNVLEGINKLIQKK